MKVSYNVIKKYLKNVKNVQDISTDLIMHTAEVEEIISQAQNMEKVFIWEVIEVTDHPESDKLHLVKVNIGNDTILPIVCWANNVSVWIKVPVAVIWAQLAPDFVIAKAKVRWETSEGMICSEDELGLKDERQEWIMILPQNAPIGMCFRDYLGLNDAILEIDNKAINHRPDMFSYVWVVRELNTISNEKTPLDYVNIDFSKYAKLNAVNEIPENVARYTLTKISWVQNIESNSEIKAVLAWAWVTSKWLLIDITNYSLYFYGQPTHIFDADKVVWDIVVRFAKTWEKFVALDDKEYELGESDIVIADSEKILALGWIIWWKSSCVDNNTKNIYIESATFNQAVLRMTGRKLWVRTDALNVFEKDTLKEMCSRWASLIVTNLLKDFPLAKVEWHFDSYEVKQAQVEIDFDLNFINKLIWANYSKELVLSILDNLWINLNSNNKLVIPFWRKDLNYIADIAEEVARIDGYDNVESTVPDINLWAVIQDNMYKLKNDAISFLVNSGWMEVYNNSLIWKDLMNRAKMNCDNLVPLHNFLSEEWTHLRSSIVPFLLSWTEKNIRDNSNIKIFEIEKVFSRNWSNITEKYSFAWVMTSNKDVPYYEIQNVITNFLKSVFVDRFAFDIPRVYPEYCHKWRTASLVVRGQEVWYVGEVHPSITKEFNINSWLCFFEINLEALLESVYKIVKAKWVSNFQANNFDLNFVVDKTVKWSDILNTIAWVDKTLIKNVEVFDIYENEDKLPGKRSISFKIYIQSLDETLWDEVKWDLIKKIIEKVKVKWGELR